MQKLTHKQKLFVEAYLAKPNGVQAAKAAGYKGNDKTLSVVASENLLKPCIKSRVEERLKVDLDAAIMTANEVLSELSAVGRGSHSTYRADKLKALDLMGKHYKLFTERIETVNIDALSSFETWLATNPEADHDEIAEFIERASTKTGVDAKLFREKVETIGASKMIN